MSVHKLKIYLLPLNQKLNHYAVTTKFYSMDFWITIRFADRSLASRDEYCTLTCTTYISFLIKIYNDNWIY